MLLKSRPDPHVGNVLQLMHGFFFANQQKRSIAGCRIWFLFNPRGYLLFLAKRGDF